MDFPPEEKPLDGGEPSPAPDVVDGGTLQEAVYDGGAP